MQSKFREIRVDGYTFIVNDYINEYTAEPITCMIKAILKVYDDVLEGEKKIELMVNDEIELDFDFIYDINELKKALVDMCHAYQALEENSLCR